MNAWLALILPPTGLYLDALREVYESFVIYSFLRYLFNFLHYDTNLQQYIDYKPGPQHIFPLCCLPTCVGGKTLLIRCKHGILQYVIIRPLTTVIAFSAQLAGFYGEGNYNPLNGQAFPILLLVNNVSQIIAMYCLVIFYTSYNQELRPMKPLGKFFSIKLVVFFSFFQSVVISALMEYKPIGDFISELFYNDGDKIAIGRKLQELLICFDMLIASIAHQFAFPHKPFVDDEDYGLGEDRTLVRSRSSSSSKGRSYREAFMNLMDFQDEKSDLGDYLIHLFNRFRALFKIGNPLPRVVPMASSQQMRDGASALGTPSTDSQTNSSTTLNTVSQYESAEYGPSTSTDSYYSGSTNTLTNYRSIT